MTHSPHSLVKAGDKGLDIRDQLFGHQRDRFFTGPADVRGDDQVGKIQLQERVVRRTAVPRLSTSMPGAAEEFHLQSVIRQRLFVNETAARRVDQNSVKCGRILLSSVEPTS